MDYEVTIGIPVYNIEKYVRLAMDSALAQTFESIEFLVLDDCGTDDSMNIVRQYQQTHPRGQHIRIVRQPQNGGLGQARNRIMDEARGRYLYHLDGDDAIAPNTIELLYEQAVAHDADIVYGSYQCVFTENDKVERTEQHVYPKVVFTEPDEYACFAYDGGVQTTTWNFLVKIDILRGNGLRVAPVGFGEDFTFTVDLPTYITRAVLIPDVTYSYFIRDVNTKRWDRNVNRQTMDNYVKTIDEKKRRTELKEKPYYAKRCEMLLMYDLSFVGQILQRRDKITPHYMDREIRDVMWNPMTCSEIVKQPYKRLKLLSAKLISLLPPGLAVFLLRIKTRTGVKD